jgi:hypothetical protein
MKLIKGVETFAKHGGYQYLGRFPLTKELNKAAPGSTSANMLTRDIPFPIPAAGNAGKDWTDDLK